MISYICVNHNSSSKLIRAVQSFAGALQGHELIIVDNSESDVEFQKLAVLKSSNIQILKMKNIGFGAACNLGSKVSQGSILAFINPDVIIKTRDISEWIIKKSNSDFLFFSPTLRYMDERPQPTGQSYSNLMAYIFQTLRLGAAVRELGLLPLLSQLLHFLNVKISVIDSYNKSITSSEDRSCDWVSGAFLICRKEAFFSVQGFDETFFLYSEDEDLCRRLAMNKPAKGIVFADAEVYHEVGGTQKIGSFGRPDMEKYRSRLLYLQKHEGPLSAAIYLGFCYLINILLLVLGLLFLDKKSAENRFRFFKFLSKSFGGNS